MFQDGILQNKTSLDVLRILGGIPGSLGSTTHYSQKEPLQVFLTRGSTKRSPWGLVCAWSRRGSAAERKEAACSLRRSCCSAQGSSLL